jgi:hypothetical protein
MNVKSLPMFAGVITTAAIAATSLTAFAQAPPTQKPPTQTAPAQTPSRSRIVFSQEQQAKFEDIKKTTITDIDGVLNAEQKKQFAAGRENGQGLGAVQNLSDSQKKKIMEHLQTFNTKIGDILTAEQKQQIEQSQPRQQSQPKPSPSSR